MSEKLGEILVKKGVITQAQLQKALEEQKRVGGKIGNILIKLGFINEETLISFLSKQYGIPFVNLSEYDIDPELIKFVPSEIAHKERLIPINRVGSTLIVAVSDPSNVHTLEDIKFITGYNVEAVIASDSQISKAIEKYYDVADSIIDSIAETIEDVDVEIVREEEEISVRELEREVEEAPVVKLVNFILHDAIKKGASDIHMEPYEKEFRIRYRIDGVLYEMLKPPMKLKNAIISRVKIMAQLDIAERRLPQDGRIKLKISKDRDIDFRVSVIPTIFGEKIVLRILDKSSLQLDMTKLGFEEDQLRLFKEAISKPYGMVLVTGPTGSGKTTTLYSALTELNTTGRNIITAEDPVEYNLPGINQVQMHEEIGLNFATALRAFLRQDPNIIMVGEIRDFETAEIAVKAALTGHLVLSTLHTNDAPQTINRLLNMGVEPFLVSSSVNLVAAQRLARKICNECKESVKVPLQALIDIGVKPDDATKITCYRGKGCSICNNTGYKGRIALYEVLAMTDEIRELILTGASSLEIKREAVRQGMKTLRQSGINKLKQGIISLEEVLRNTAPD